jgi:hypothetical protein
MYTIDENGKKKKPTNKKKSSQNTRGPCFLPQTQKHVHNIRKKIQFTNKARNETNHATCI